MKTVFMLSMLMLWISATPALAIGSDSPSADHLVLAGCASTAIDCPDLKKSKKSKKSKKPKSSKKKKSGKDKTS